MQGRCDAATESSGTQAPPIFLSVPSSLASSLKVPVQNGFKSSSHYFSLLGSREDGEREADSFKQTLRKLHSPFWFLVTGQIVVTWPHTVTGKPWKCGLWYWAGPDKEVVHLVRLKGRMEDGRPPAVLQLSLGERVCKPIPVGMHKEFEVNAHLGI